MLGSDYNGSSTHLFLSSNAGTSWEESFPLEEVGVELKKISMNADGSNLAIIALGGDTYSIFVSLDNGATWSIPTGLPASQYWQDIRIDATALNMLAWSSSEAYSYNVYSSAEVVRLGFQRCLQIQYRVI